jgi:hypothetical protein
LKKRIIAWAVLLSVCAAALGLWCSAAAGKTARTLPCEEEGLILSITTFDGKSESKPFLKCFGHTWIGLDNRTGHTVYLKDRAIPDGEMVTFSVWAVSGLSGLLFDLEPCYIANYGRYSGRLSLSTNIGEEQLKVIEDYMEQHDKWTVDKNCSYWSVHLWNAVVGEEAALKIRGFVCTPEKIEQAFSAFDCVEVNKDFSRAGGIYCYKDGENGAAIMFVRFITSRLLRVIVCAAAGLYGLYNAISCFVTLYKAGHQPYLMAGAVRFDFQGYYMMAAMHVGICLLLGVLVWLFLKGTKKLREKTAVR